MTKTKTLTSLRRFAIASFLWSIAISAYGATVSATQFSQGFGGNCVPPPAVTSFTTRDPQIWVYFLVEQAQGGDLAKIEWVGPDTNDPRTSTYAPLPSSGNWCFNSALVAPDNLYRPLAGTWTVRLYWNNLVISTTTVPIVNAPAPPTQLSSYVMSKALASTTSCTAPQPASTFLTTDNSALLWFLFSSIARDSVVQSEFVGPDGNKYDGQTWTVPYDGEWCFWSDLYLSGKPPGNLPGNWIGKVRVDGVQLVSAPFTVTALGAPILSKTTDTATAGGGSGSVTITASGNWTAVSNVPWITIVTGATGTGNGTITYFVSPNTVTSPRTGTITIAGITFTIIQAAGTGTAPFPLTLTSQGIQAGFKLSLFADNFPFSRFGPMGIEFPSSGGVLVSDDSGDIRKFPTRNDGQHANLVPVTAKIGTGRGMTKSGGKVYLGDLAGRILQLNDDGTVNQVIIGSGLAAVSGLAVNPANGHIFAADRSRIVDINPVTKTVTTFTNVANTDGLTITSDGTTLYAAISTGILGFRISDGAQVFDSGFISGGPDGAMVGAGSLAGLLFVNNNDGRVIQINLNTKVQTVVATGGSRGDFIAVDPFDGSLLLTQLDHIVRLSPAGGSTFAPPTINVIGNGAEFTSSMSPGSLATIVGSGLAPVIRELSVPYPASANGVSLKVNGLQAPIAYLSPWQLNFQIPASVSPGAASVVLTNNGIVSPAFAIQVSNSAPGVFQWGANRGVIQNQNYSLNEPGNPAPANGVVFVYLTGIGPTAPTVADGAAAPVSPLAVSVLPYSATIGGRSAQVLFLGLTPGFAGLGQANLRIPSGLATGDYPLVITINGQSSQPVLVAVRAANGIVGDNKDHNKMGPALPCVPVILENMLSASSTQALAATQPSAEPPVNYTTPRKMEEIRMNNACYNPSGALLVPHFVR